MKKLWKVINTETEGSVIVPPESKYHLTYKKGTTVKMIPGTVGIAVFVSEKAAIEFLGLNQDQHIVRVECYGEKEMPIRLATYHLLKHLYDPEFDAYYKDFGNIIYKDQIKFVPQIQVMFVPKGSAFYKRVVVL